MFIEQLKSQLPTILIEMVSVIFAVLLALALNQWREERSQVELAADALEKVTREIDTNRAKLEKVLPGQTQELERFSAGLEELEATVASGSEGPSELSLEFSFESLQDTAWRTAIVTEAVRFIDFDTVSQLSSIYGIQELLEESQRAVLRAMTSVDLYGEDVPVARLKSLQATYHQAVEMERKLLEVYGDYLATHPL